MTIANQPTDNLLKNFKLLLITEKVTGGTIRSYLSDTRHFLGWLNLYLKGQHGNKSLTLNQQLILIKKKLVDNYLGYLVDNQLPHKTVNRRLSALRKFGLFCQNQGWIPENYFAYLKNIPASQSAPEDRHRLNQYKAELIKQGSTSQTVKNYLSDVRHFINWIAQGDALPCPWLGKQDDGNRPNGKASPYKQI